MKNVYELVDYIKNLLKERGYKIEKIDRDIRESEIHFGEIEINGITTKLKAKLICKISCWSEYGKKYDFCSVYFRIISNDEILESVSSYSISLRYTNIIKLKTEQSLIKFEDVINNRKFDKRDLIDAEMCSQLEEIEEKTGLKIDAHILRDLFDNIPGDEEEIYVYLIDEILKRPEHLKMLKEWKEIIDKYRVMLEV